MGPINANEKTITKRAVIFFRVTIAIEWSGRWLEEKNLLATMILTWHKNFCLSSDIFYTVHSDINSFVINGSVKLENF